MDSLCRRQNALFIGLMVLFIHLKIILLRCFQFSVSVKISCIQTEVCVWLQLKKLAYFCYYSWVILYFLVLFMGLTVLFHLTFTLMYNTFSKKFSIPTKKTDLKQTLSQYVGVTTITTIKWWVVNYRIVWIDVDQLLTTHHVDKLW